MRCAKCSRPLKRPAPSGYGPVCAAAVLGVKPRRARRLDKTPPVADERQVELFAEAQP